MSHPRIITFCLLLALATALPLQAQDTLPGPNWARRDALQAAAAVDVLAELKPLFEHVRAGRDDALLQALQRIAGAEQWPPPARERILHAFALGLGDLPTGSVGPGILDFLLAYRPQTRVAHPDTDLVGVPLFDIATATTGVVNAWERQAGRDSARGLLPPRGADPGWASQWTGAYLAAGPARRQGFADALDTASPEQVRELAAAAVDKLTRTPDMTLVAARCAMLLADSALLREVLATGRGPGLAAALQWADAALPESERIDLLQRLSHDAPPASAALAIAALAPGLLQHPEVADWLFALLADPALGAAAALTLSHSDAPAVQGRLADLAAAGDALSARRAAVAIEAARRTNAGGER
ncbi:MAG: hypothetical protein EHM68_05580 [Lysobacterales bacterium]|nr:MAG: hypothetical protein EHM68_05580 [Xanthomonadales bacterium]